MDARKNYLLYTIGVGLFFISLTSLHAQITNEKYQTESIYLKGKKYVKNGVEYPITSWGGALKKEMEVSPDAVMEYDKFQRKHKTAFILGTLGGVAIISAFFVNNDGIQNGLFLGGAGLLIASIPINAKAYNVLQKSIWLRNGAGLN